LLVILACPLLMAAMMFLMMRGGRARDRREKRGEEDPA
jgi:hypothetical protein